MLATALLTELRQWLYNRQKLNTLHETNFFLSFLLNSFNSTSLPAILGLVGSSWSNKIQLVFWIIESIDSFLFTFHFTSTDKLLAMSNASIADNTWNSVCVCLIAIWIRLETLFECQCAEFCVLFFVLPICLQSESSWLCGLEVLIEERFINSFPTLRLFQWFSI